MERIQTKKTACSPELKVNNFERITRWMRWYVICGVVLLFPFDPSRVYYLYGLAFVAILFNVSRYFPVFMRSRWYPSTLLMILVDNIFLAALIALTGDVVTLFTGFLAYTIITASYRYKLTGTLVVVASQLIWLYVAHSQSWFTPVHFELWRTIALAAAVLAGIGIFVERLTRLERQERDVLERLSEDLEAGQKHLVTLLDSLNDAIFVVDGDGKIQDFNTAAVSLCNEDDDLQGKSFMDALQLRPHVNQDAEPHNLLKEVGPQHRRDLSVKDANGAVTDLDITVKPVDLEGRKTTDFIIVCKDITKERSLDEQRNEFISVVSHELRTPISIMEAALSLVQFKKDKLDEQTGALVVQAHTQSVFLGSLVKDLATIAHANNDNLPVQFEQIDATVLLQQMANDFKASATQKGIEIDVLIEEKTPLILSTKSHIREILQNYITNAIKYSKEGRVVLRAEASKSGGVILSVKDGGIGITPDDQKHLFKKFFRSEDTRTRERGGTGLGLYLCMEIAQRLNGKVWCESELNKGSTFFLEIPPVSHLRRDQKQAVKTEVANLVAGV
jgi:PAS domain S-box-containing protein